MWRPLTILRVRIGAGYSWTRAKEKDWRSAGPQARLGASLSLPWGFTVGAQAGFYWTDYEGDGRRHFNRQSQAAQGTDSVSFPSRCITAPLTLYGFSPRLSVVNQQRETNAQVLDFRRTHGELSFVRQF